MRAIRAKDTKPEKAVRSIVHRLGFRFRLHRKDLPGRPDIVLPRLRTVILVHGCFWHRHHGCPFAYLPKARRDFWTRKFETNARRDLRVQRDLEELGWCVITVWECELRDQDQLRLRLFGLLARPARRARHRRARALT
jgi:DNA mismatch endonuclease (patch repair protein)